MNNLLAFISHLGVRKMKSVVFVLIAIISLQSHAGFSMFLNVEPDTPYELDEGIESMRVEKMEDGSFLVKVPEFLFKHIWLITCNWELKDDQKELRDDIWKSNKDDRVLDVTAKQGDNSAQTCTKDVMSAEDGFVDVILSDDFMSRSYIYIDYPNPVFDGGYYYSIDLPAYLRKINSDEN
jgi:hypothetical protein